MTRFFDFVFASLALLVLAPLLLAVMAVLRFTGEGEVFYLQERVGKGGASFRVFKFVTMVKDSPNLPGGYLTSKGDPRVLPVGRVLRKAKINELPQFFNVWLGEMSLVGPRPQARVHYDLFSARQKEAIQRQTPGLTGLGSLVFRDEESLLERSGEDPESFHDHVITPFKGELERWYAEHANLGSYFKILLLTALSLVRPGLDSLRFFPGAPAPPPELRDLLRGA